jgi:hypothetical protein
MAKVMQESAIQFLASVPDNKKFWCTDGAVFSTLKELESGFKSMKKDIFNFHVNSEKNDFSSWIYDVVGDIKLADDLRSVKDAKTAAKIVRNRISNLKE